MVVGRRFDEPSCRCVCLCIMMNRAAAGGATSLVVDAEIVAVDRGHPAAPTAGVAAASASAATADGADGDPQPRAAAADVPAADGNGVRLRAFQELSTRARGEITADQVLLGQRRCSLVRCGK